MVFEEIRVSVEVDGFESELAKTFTAVGVGGRMGGYTTASEFATCTVLEWEIWSAFARIHLRQRPT